MVRRRAGGSCSVIGRWRAVGRGWPAAAAAVLMAMGLLTGCPTDGMTGGNDNGNANTNGNDNANSNSNSNTNDNGIGDPGCSDRDDDGFCDDLEINSTPGTDPLDPEDNPDNVKDADADGCSDFDETNFPGFCDNNPNTPPGTETPPITTPGGNVTVSGTILVGASSLVDGDTNDPTAAVVDNDGVGTGQSLPNPAVVGGFLGTTFEKVDSSDVYRVQMADGQTATLFLADPIANDFDLFLYDADGEPLDSSEGTGKAEVVMSPSNGTYLVEVFGYSVSNNGDPGGLYTLLIGENALGAGAAQAAREKLSSLHDYVEGEVVLKRRDAGDATRRAKLVGDHGLETIEDGSNSGGFERMRIRSIDRHAKIGGAAMVDRGGLRRPTSPTLNAIKSLRRAEGVENADPNYIRHVTREPNDEFFAFQWHYPLISLPAAWDVTTGSNDVIVAVVDTGVVLNHPDMLGQTVAGFDFISEASNALDGNGIDADANDPGDTALPGGRSTFHGTHVSGTVAARTNNTTGGAGVAWDARIMPIRVLGRLGGIDTDIAQGIRFAAGLTNSSGTLPPQRADVINMSLGGQGISTIEQAAITTARQAGVIVVVAAGNEQSNAQFFSPAGLDGVVTVSAVGPSRALAPYSNFGETIEVAAPGGDLSVDLNSDSFPDGVLSSVGDDGGGLFSLQQGTSMASPHVAGVVALMKAVNPGLTPDAFDQLLAGTHPGTTVRITDDLAPAGRDNSFGHGLINALSAVRAAEDIIGMATVDTPVLAIVPRSVDFGSSATSATIAATNGGVGSLNITGVSSDEPWLTVTPTSGGAGAFMATVNRTGLADGVYSGRLTFASNGGDAAVTVQVTVGDRTTSAGDVGTLYVLLVEETTFESAAQANLTAAGGYAFEMADVAPGNYFLFAGTDLDNDSFLGDEGEAFGGYPTVLDPVVLITNQNRTGLTFASTFEINIQTPGTSSVKTGAATPRPIVRRIAPTPR
ncbi:MAG: S8 family serine peptidase [Phycisphaerales bacterium]|nr:S8 family serine peptidase [Phycisphaerales bacterium]